MTGGTKYPDALSGIEARYPGLVDRVRRLIEGSERAYNGDARDGGSSFLWEHTVHVASYAQRIALAEKRDPVPAVLAALFHDAGKFRGGRYHPGQEPEEETAAAAARMILPEFAVPPALIEDIVSGLRALYNEKRSGHPLAAVVHDADFLSKSGSLGVAHFFVKSTLRGRTLRDAVMNTLSKELTYAAVLPLNMRTGAGRALARSKSRDSLRFFDRFLGELNEAAPPGFRIATLRIRGTHHLITELSDVSPEFIKVRVVVPVGCERCDGSWRYEHSIAAGVKCRELRVLVRCGRCDNRFEISFCLPEL
jgi:HD superfamily phosphodiesterase